jgi:hypothetical protein
MIVDHKYDLSPNILRATPVNCSPFWKGVIWAASVAKVGYKWNVGNETKSFILQRYLAWPLLPIYFMLGFVLYCE